jgi:hypothetical protein
MVDDARLGRCFQLMETDNPGLFRDNYPYTGIATGG